MIFYDKEPYPYIKFIAIQQKGKSWVTQKELVDIAYEWCIRNYDEIVKRLKSLDSYIKINEEIWRKRL